MTAIDVEVQVGTGPDLEADVQIAPPTFTILSVLPTGPRGPAGPTGADGAPGADSTVPGPEGPEGPAGQDGDTGPAGADGDDGREVQLQKTATHIQWRYVGEVAWTNLVALVDITGPAGQNGADGADGQDGADGADGTDGTNGTNGIDGRTVLNGSGAPAGGTGANGDFYIRTSDWTIYGPKAAGSWPAPVSLVGPSGADGADGAPGADGADGADGSPDTAAQVLAKLLTVDGAGSGLDADLLDGQSSAAFEVAGAAAAAQAASQPLDSDLTAIAALTPSNDDVVQRKAGVWTSRTIAQLLVDLAAPGTTFQPLDSDLTAIAALSTTSFGRALLELANASAMRTAAGLILGTDIYSKAAVDAGFQPLDSDLTAIAALTTTSYGRSLLAAADASALRTLAGLVLGTDVYSKSAVDSGFQPLDADLTAIAALTTTTYGRGLLALANQAALIAELAGAYAPLVHAGSLIGLTSYDPASMTTVTTTSSTFADIDATNLAVTFTVPASGKVLIKLTCGYDVDSGNQIAWGIREGSTLINSGKVRYDTSGDAENTGTLALVVSGLTPAASKTYKFAHARAFGSAGCKTRYGGDPTGLKAAPAVIEVWAAP